MRRFLLSILFFVFANVSLKAGDDVPHQIFKLIYNQQYDSAHFVLNQNKGQLDGFYLTVLEIDLSYWENVTGTEGPNYEMFETTLKNHEVQNPETLDEQASGLVVQSYRLRYALKRYHLFSALKTRKSALGLYDSLKENKLAFDPEQTEVFKLYSALISYFNHYLGSYFSRSSKAELSKAIHEMEKLSDSDFEMVKTLGSYFLGKIYLQYEKEPEKGIHLFAYLAENYPNNQRFQEYLQVSKEKSVN